MFLLADQRRPRVGIFGVTRKRPGSPLFVRPRLNLVTEGEPARRARARVNPDLFSFDLRPRTCHLTGAPAFKIFSPSARIPCGAFNLFKFYLRTREAGTETGCDRIIHSGFREENPGRYILLRVLADAMARLIIRKVEPFATISRMKIFFAYLSASVSVCGPDSPA